MGTRAVDTISSRVRAVFTVSGKIFRALITFRNNLLCECEISFGDQVRAVDTFETRVFIFTEFSGI